MEPFEKILAKDEKKVTSKEVLDEIRRLNKCQERAYTDLANFEAELSKRKERPISKNLAAIIKDLNSKLDAARRKIRIFNFAELKMKLLFKKACNNEIADKIDEIDQKLIKIDRTWFESSLKILKICGQVEQIFLLMNLTNSIPIGNRVIPDMKAGENLESYLNQFDATMDKKKLN